jgi:ATP-dependent DNA helicase RecG
LSDAEVIGKGFDRICREQEVNGANVPSFRTDDFILKITVPKVADISSVQSEKVIETEQKVTEKLTENHQKLIEKLIEKAVIQGDRLTENRKSILRLVIEDPYISKADFITVPLKWTKRSLK